MQMTTNSIKTKNNWMRIYSTVISSFSKIDVLQVIIIELKYMY